MPSGPIESPSRRRFLGAVGTGTGMAWVAPTLVTLPLAALAPAGSLPPGGDTPPGRPPTFGVPPGGNVPPGGELPTSGSPSGGGLLGEITTPGVPAAGAPGPGGGTPVVPKSVGRAVSAGEAPTGLLARTGANLPLVAEVGAVAVVAGGALVRAARLREDADGGPERGTPAD